MNAAQPEESISAIESARIKERIATVLRNYESLELRRTTTLRHYTTPSSSALSVLISPPTERELEAARNFGEQYLDGLSAAGKDEMISRLMVVHKTFATRTSTYVAMFMGPPDGSGEARVRTEINEVTDGPEFLQEFQQTGTLRLGPGRIEVNGGPPDDWRYNHIFAIQAEEATTTIPAERAQENNLE
jgi:hypothetical protein